MICQGDARYIPLAANSVDLIFTDPPYSKTALPSYSWLAHEAVRILRPEAFVLAMCGGAFLDEVFRSFSESGLTFYWKYEIELVGWATGVYWPRGNHKVQVTTRVKSILAYSKGPSLSRTSTLGLFRSDGADKRYHHWGQDVSSARYYIDCFSKPGDLVLDPFVGGGTTLVACQLLGRRGIGIDLDKAACTTSRDRLVHSDTARPLPLFT